MRGLVGASASSQCNPGWTSFPSEQSQCPHPGSSYSCPNLRAAFVSAAMSGRERPQPAANAWKPPRTLRSRPTGGEARWRTPRPDHGTTVVPLRTTTHLSAHGPREPIPPAAAPARALVELIWKDDRRVRSLRRGGSVADCRSSGRAVQRSLIARLAEARIHARIRLGKERTRKEGAAQRAHWARRFFACVR